jgi:DNA-binding transcriptional LysR family regulator
MADLNLDHLAMLRAVLAHGSFSRAADSIGISQPAASMQVRQLEAAVGMALVERTGRKLRPTAAGAELVARADAIDVAIKDALDAMKPHRSGRAGRIRIGVGATACIFLLPPILKDLKARFPEYEITVRTGNTPDFIDAIFENLMDIGLLTMPVSGRMLMVEPVITDEFVMVATPALPLAEPMTPAIVAALPLIQFGPGGNTRLIVDDWLRAGGAAAKPVMSLGSVEAIKELVKAGLGCAILPSMAVRAIDAGLVVRSLTPRLERRLAIVMREDKPLTRGLKALIAALREAGAPPSHPR